MKKKLLSSLFLLGAVLILTACGAAVEYPDSQVPLEEDPSESWLYSFDQTQGYNFLFLCDTDAQDGEAPDYEALSRLAATAGQEENLVKFVLHGGDVVRNSDNPEEWTLFWDAYAPLADLPTYVSWGEEDEKNLEDHFKFNYNGPGQMANRFYSFSYENALFVYLDGVSMGLQRQEYTDWLTNLTANTTAEWIIAISHYSLYPAANLNNDLARAEAQRKIWAEVLEDCGVDLVLCGHQKLYARTYPMRDGAVATDGQGITFVQVCSGSDLAKVEEWQSYVQTYKTDVSNFCLLNINGSTLNLVALDPDGVVLDEFSMTK